MRVTVRQKQKGRGNPWWVFVHHNNQRKSLKIGSKKMAEKTAAEIRRRARLGKVTVDGEEEREDVIPKFGDYADHFLETYAKTACKRNTWLGYISAINYHLKPAWAEKRLDRITRAEVKRLLLKKQRDGLAPATVNNLRNIVSAIYTFAREDEVVDHNPAKGLGRYIKKVDQKQHIQVLTREQSRLLLETVKEHFPWHYPIILCAFRTGMRMGELLGLGWEDVDFEANTITVRRSYTQQHWAVPKTHRSRVVDMSDQLKLTLMHHRETLGIHFRGRFPTAEVVAPGHEPKRITLLFPNKVGKPMDGGNLLHRAFRRSLEKADLPAIRFHDIRHTYASLLLQQGESIHYVKEQLGHASIQTTVDVYGHLVPGSNRNAVNQLDDPQLTLVGAEAS